MDYFWKWADVMSAILQLLLSSGAKTLVMGSLSGSGSLTIPAGVTTVTMTGRGGVGAQTYYPQVGNPSYPSGLPPYNAGQPYIAPVNPSATLYYWGSALIPSSITVSITWAAYDAAAAASQSPITSSSGLSGYPSTVTDQFNIPRDFVGAVDFGLGVAYQPGYLNVNLGYGPAGGYGYVGEIYASSGSRGQPYIAPTGNPSYPSGLPPYQAAYTAYTYGPNTTATLNGVTRTWTGGYGSVAGTESQQTLTSNGLGQSLSYDVGSGGSLSYSYYK